jgi:pyruvate dehydrogenase E1 component beta subunit
MNFWHTWREEVEIWKQRDPILCFEAYLERGEDVTAIVYGLMFHETLKAAEGLANQGVSVEVIDLRTLHPLDKETILNLRFALNRSDIWQPK